MNIYTFKFSSSLCDILNISHEPLPHLSDQELSKIPDDAINGKNGWGKSGFKRLDESNRLQSQAQKGKIWCHDPVTLEEKLTHNMPADWVRGRSPKTKHGGRLGVYDENRFKKMSNSLKGRKIWNTGIGHSENTKNKLRCNALNRPIFVCPHCEKSIKGESNLNQHIRGRH
jgi:hypothetical protein